MFTWVKHENELHDPWMDVPEETRNTAELHEFHDCWPDGSGGAVCFFYYIKETDTVYIREIKIKK